MSNLPQINLNISDSQLLLINILNTIYNDNVRQITSLTSSNNEIRQIITNLLSNGTNHNARSRNRHNTNNNRWNSTRNTNANRNEDRIYINSLPYVIGNVREFRVPSSNINNWVNSLDSSYLDTSGNSWRPRTHSTQTRNYFSEGFQRFFEPVQVFPTQTQVENATRNVMYCDVISPINRSCPISLDNFNDSDTVTVIRPCGHIFNPDHLNRWFRTNCRCPVCRYDIREYVSPTSRDLFSNYETTEPSPTRETNNLNETIDNHYSYNNIPANLNQRNATTTTTNNDTTYTNHFFNAIINDVTPENVEDIGNALIDSSGNFLSDISGTTILYTLLNVINNRNHAR